MRVCVFYDEETYGFTPADFLKHYPCEWEMVTLSRPVREKIRVLAEQNKYDVYFNLCDGASDEQYPGVDVVEALEEFNMPFTGSNSRAYDPTREEMQAVADANGIGFAKGHRVNAGEDVVNVCKDLRYPIMVKHPQSYSSMGMTRASRCDTTEQLLTQFKLISAEFGSARVEEFVVGREFNVFIAGAHGGVSVGPDGATHQALEELFQMCGLPNMTVVVPCDYIETKRASEYALFTIKGPKYLRFAREATPMVTTFQTPWKFGEANVIRYRGEKDKFIDAFETVLASKYKNENEDLAIIACGPSVPEAMRAAYILKQEFGLETRIVNMHTIKPLDKAAIIKAGLDTNVIIDLDAGALLTEMFALP